MSQKPFENCSKPPYSDRRVLIAVHIFISVWALFKKKIVGHKSFFWSHWCPCFRFLVMSALGFKARMDPLLVCFLTCAQWIPQIHLWCDTCWPLDSQYGSQSRSLHACSRCRIPRFDWETAHTISRHTIHSATVTGFVWALLVSLKLWMHVFWSNLLGMGSNQLPLNL